MQSIIEILNAPITIWLLTTVIVGVISWQYKRIQAESEERKLLVVLKQKVEEEFYLLSEDLKFVSSQKEAISIHRIQYLIERTQYLPFDLRNKEYRPTLYNILLELQSYDLDHKFKLKRIEIFRLLKQLILLRDKFQIREIEREVSIWSSLDLEDKEVIAKAHDFYSELSSEYQHVFQIEP